MYKRVFNVDNFTCFYRLVNGIQEINLSPLSHLPLNSETKFYFSHPVISILPFHTVTGATQTSKLLHQLLTCWRHSPS